MQYTLYSGRYYKEEVKNFKVENDLTVETIFLSLKSCIDFKLRINDRCVKKIGRRPIICVVQLELRSEYQTRAHALNFETEVVQTSKIPAFERSYCLSPDKIFENLDLPKSSL